MTVYTTLSTGPRRPEDLDGPEEYHVVLLDNGRADMLGGAFQDMLRCIRCAACMNACPVYKQIGGHAYGWVYPGPMGAVLTPGLRGVEEAGHLPNASTFCGKCEEVCPVRIPLPRMMRHWREREFARRLSAGRIPLRARHMGLLSLAACALPAVCGHRRADARRAEALAAAALRRRLDRHAGLPGIGGPELHEPLARGAEALKPWRRGRPCMSASWRRKGRAPSRSVSTCAG